MLAPELLNMLVRHYNAEAVLHIGGNAELLDMVDAQKKKFIDIAAQYKASDTQGQTPPLQDKGNTACTGPMPSVKGELQGADLFDIIFISDCACFQDAERLFEETASHAHKNTLWVFADTVPSSPYAGLPDDIRDMCTQRSGLLLPPGEADIYKFIFALHDRHTDYSYCTLAGNGGHTIVWHTPGLRREAVFQSRSQIENATFADILIHEHIFMAISRTIVFDIIGISVTPRDYVDTNTRGKLSKRLWTHNTISYFRELRRLKNANAILNQKNTRLQSLLKEKNATISSPKAIFGVWARALFKFVKQRTAQNTKQLALINNRADIFHVRFSPSEKRALLAEFAVPQRQRECSDACTLHLLSAEVKCPKEITFIVSVHDSADTLEECLSSIVCQKMHEADIILSGPKFDNAIKHLARKYGCLAFIESTHIGALVYAHNTELRSVVTSRYMVFLQASQIPDHKFVLKFLAAARTTLSTLVTSARYDTLRPGSAIGARIPIPAKEYIRPACGNFVYGAFFGTMYSTETFFAVTHATPAPPNELKGSFWELYLFFIPLALHSKYMVFINDVLHTETRPTLAPCARIEWFRELGDELHSTNGYLHSALPDATASDIGACLQRAVVPQIIEAVFQTIPRSNAFRQAVGLSYLANFLEILSTRLSEDEFEELVQNIPGQVGASHFLALPKSWAIHAVITGIMNALRKHSPDYTLVYEAWDMEDLHTFFVDQTLAQYPVRYIRPKYTSAYPDLELFIDGVAAARARCIIASSAAAIAAPPSATALQRESGRRAYDGLYGSAPAGSAPCSNMFAMAQDRVFSPGAHVADSAFDEQKIAQARADIEARFPDLRGKKICFFAPTYREGTPEWYRCSWDYAALDALLAEHNIVVIYKNHPIFDAIRAHTGLICTDLHDSPRKYVREADGISFSRALAACDFFMTDYSSAQFYALAMNKPVLYYAPDLEDYCLKSGAPSAVYADTVPGPVVTDTAPAALTSAFASAQAMALSDKYARFRRLYTGMRTGNTKSGKKDALPYSFLQLLRH